MHPVRYIFVNCGLGMSPGKAAAQAAHAEMLALVDYFNNASERSRTTHTLFDEWYDSGHYTKLVMDADCAERLESIREYLAARNYRTYMVIDEGRTEIDPFTKTALAVELVDKDDARVQSHFQEFKVYKPPKPPKPRRLSRWDRFGQYFGFTDPF